MKRATIFCVHYQAAAEHKTCKVGVAYDQFKGQGVDGFPCFAKAGEAHPAAAKCSQCKMPTEEELAAEEATFAARFEKMALARKAIVQHLGGSWKKGTPSAGGAIDCPVCKTEKSLRFNRSGYNGHIHASCCTPGCVCWVE